MLQRNTDKNRKEVIEKLIFGDDFVKRGSGKKVLACQTIITS